MRFGYDGGRFHGVPPQPGLPTVGGTLLARIESVFEQRPRNLAYTSRTDGGVHAIGNLSTCWFLEVPDLEQRLAALCQHRPDGLLNMEAVHVSKPIHARGLSLGKHYRYCLETGFSTEELEAINARVSWRGRLAERAGSAPPPADMIEASTWQVHPPLDLERLRRAAAHMVGTHDFNALRTTRCSANITVKTVDSIHITVSEAPAGRVRYTVDIRGQSFLRKMVRVMMGTLIEVGVGVRDPDSIPALIQSRDRRKAGITAPSRGLTLREIFLETDWFDPDVRGRG
jgi:tRNA pseudouridine38-40 synthase